MVFVKEKSLFIFFVLVSILALVFGVQLDALKMNHWVILGANTLLFAISIFTLFMHQASIKSANPKAFINSVMVGMIVKLLVIGVAILLYIDKAGVNKNVYAVYVGMLLYLVYTALEVNIALQLNKKPNANH
jgi:small-conductance mechanosensitive channel